MRRQWRQLKAPQRRGLNGCAGRQACMEVVGPCARLQLEPHRADHQNLAHCAPKTSTQSCPVVVSRLIRPTPSQQRLGVPTHSCPCRRWWARKTRAPVQCPHTCTRPRRCTHPGSRQPGGRSSKAGCRGVKRRGATQPATGKFKHWPRWGVCHARSCQFAPSTTATRYCSALHGRGAARVGDAVPLQHLQSQLP